LPIENKDEKNQIVEPLSEGLFSEEALGMGTAKATALETFLNIITLDYKFQDFIREILMVILKVVKSEAGSILEVDPVNHTLFFRAVAGHSSDQVMNFVIPFGQGIVGYVAESHLPLVVDNVPENKVHLKSIEKAIGFETRNIAAMPLLIRGRIYGVLELLNRIGEANFTPSDVELLAYLCQMASKAIEARLMIAWSKKQAQRISDPRGEAA
jgi:GAF domain-containing protein